MSSQAPLGEQLYAGQRLGLPEHGPRSVAGWGRRLAAISIDWAASWGVAFLVFNSALTDGKQTLIDLFAVPLLAVVQSAIFIALIGGSFGHTAMRIMVVRLDGKPVTLLQALVRSVLVYLIIPPLVFNRDNRGLHDLAAGTITLRR